MQHLASIYAAIPFSAPTWFVLFVLSFFVWLFAQANKDPKSPVQWEHLVIDASTDRASPYKLGYLVGLIVATWLVVYLVDKDKLGLDIFGAYLTYLLGGTGINIFKRDRPTPPSITVAPTLVPGAPTPTKTDDDGDGPPPKPPVT